MALVATYDYDPWGKLLSVTDPTGAEITGPTHPANLNPIRYRGYYQDTETGFYYLQSRYYDPELKRFINADSYSSTGQGFLGHNMFAYCGNDTTNSSDSNGALSKIIELGEGWYCRVDTPKPNEGQKHIHVWNTHGKGRYSQNEDGSPHDKGNNKSGKLPKKVQKAVKEKAKWDYNGKRKSFFEQTQVEVWCEGIYYKYADGTSAFRGNSLLLPRLTIGEYESIYYSSDTIDSTLNTESGHVFYIPIWGEVELPSIMIDYSFSFAAFLFY